MGPMRRPLALNLGTALDFFLLGKLLPSSFLRDRPGHYCLVTPAYPS